MVWNISKEISFDYGHRVHTQKLNIDYSLDDACVCRHLHGHRGKIHVYLSGNKLNSQGMVTDFKHLNVIKKFFDQYVDHKFILDRSDPLFETLLNGHEKYLKPVYIEKTTWKVGSILDLNKMVNNSIINQDTPMFEYYDSFFVVDFIPTSEHLSEWSCKFIQEKMSFINVSVSRIDWWETPKSCSTFIAN